MIQGAAFRICVLRPAKELPPDPRFLTFSADANAFAPVVSLQRAVEREFHTLHSGQGAKLLLQPLIQRRQLLWRIACSAAWGRISAMLVGNRKPMGTPR